VDAEILDLVSVSEGKEGGRQGGELKHARSFRFLHTYLTASTGLDGRGSSLLVWRACEQG